MRSLKLVVFVLSLLVFGSQLIRHAYVRWIESRESVLDKYELAERSEIREAKSLSELESRYSAELARARAEEAKRTPTPAQAQGEQLAYPGSTSADAAQYDPKVAPLRSAIQEWERLENEVRELKFYWFCGLGALLVAGSLFVLCRPWPAIALTILGFSEMVWATCPSFAGDADHQFTRLLNVKIEYSLLSILVLALFFALGWLRSRPNVQADAA